MNLETYIQSYFGIVQLNELNTLVSLFKSEEIKKGQYFLKQGHPCDKLSFIQDGILRIYVQMEDREVTQWISTSGYFVTDLSSFIFNTPARFNIQALEDCSLFTIYKTDYEKIGDLVPSWHQLEKLFIAKCFTMLEDRVFGHLSLSAEERYQVLFDMNPALFNQVPLQYIASMLGMSPETLSRIRKKALS